MANLDHVKRVNIERQRLLSALGLSICAWGLVEDYLCDVLVAATRPSNKQALVQAYYAVPSIENKIRMADAAISVALDGLPKLLAEWGTLLNRLNRKKRLRNELAHCQVISTYKPVDAYLVPYFNLHNFHRLPGHSAALANPEITLKRLDTVDVIQRGEAFEMLRTQLHDFAKRISKRRMRRRKAPAPTVVPRRGFLRSERRTPKET